MHVRLIDSVTSHRESTLMLWVLYWINVVVSWSFLMLTILNVCSDRSGSGSKPLPLFIWVTNRCLLPLAAVLASWSLDPVAAQGLWKQTHLIIFATVGLIIGTIPMLLWVSAWVSMAFSKDKATLGKQIKSSLCVGIPCFCALIPPCIVFSVTLICFPRQTRIIFWSATLIVYDYFIWAVLFTLIVDWISFGVVLTLCKQPAKRKQTYLVLLKILFSNMTFMSIAGFAGTFIIWKIPCKIASGTFVAGAFGTQLMFEIFLTISVLSLLLLTRFVRNMASTLTSGTQNNPEQQLV